ISLFDGASGIPLAVLDCRVITARRTAAASALSVRECASSEASVLAILGAGVQGHSHLEFVPRVRDFGEIRIASRNPSHAQRLAEALPHARAAPSFEEAARGADVICCCTDSPEPILRRDWVRPGTHITSVGFSATGSELEPELVGRARLIVETRAVFQPPPAGAAELAGVDPATAVELGEVLGGAPGRRGPEEVTLYKSAGHAVEDLAAARLVYERALATGAGTRLPL
ncbi:MAG: NAD(P)-binding domain-containing protein, partial [Candidatus Dormibacteraeota bacterium]|nr:NAD(P)-binding domain-containing protein [Candidatus Dormibacteraeota bacterium]